MASLSRQINGIVKSFRGAIVEHRWFLMSIVWLAAIALSCWGVKLQFIATNDARSFWDPLYRTIQLIMLDDGMIIMSGKLPWQFELSRFLLPALAAGTAYLALITIFRREFSAFRRKAMRGHVVICGLGRKGMLVAEGFRKINRHVIAIDMNESESLEQYCWEHGIVLVRGDATDADTLKRARVWHATHVIALCGNDGANAEIAVRSWELMRDYPQKILSFYCHIVDPTLCRLLREQELMSEMVDNFRLAFINTFDSAARLMLERFPAWLKAFANVHIVVIGAGKMGENVIIQAARQWWEQYGRTKEKLCITVVDRNAAGKIEKLCMTYPCIAECTTLNSVQEDFNGPAFLSSPVIDQTHPNLCIPATVFVCLDNDSAGLAVALRMLHHFRNRDVPIIVRMEHDSGLATLLLGQDSRSGSAFSSLHAFGMLDSTCKPECLLNDTRVLMAKAIHQRYIDDMIKAGQSPQTNISIRPWEELPENLRESNMRQADQIGIKLHAIKCGIGPLCNWAAQPLQFTPDEIETLARMEHNRFVNERLAAKWTFAPGPKDPVKKTSPTLVPWEKLTEEEREKDRNPVKNIPGILALAGFEVYRLKDPEMRK